MTFCNTGVADRPWCGYSRHHSSLVRPSLVSASSHLGKVYKPPSFPSSEENFSFGSHAGHMRADAHLILRAPVDLVVDGR